MQKLHHIMVQEYFYKCVLTSLNNGNNSWPVKANLCLSRSLWLQEKRKWPHKSTKAVPVISNGSLAVWAYRQPFHTHVFAQIMIWALRSLLLGRKKIKILTFFFWICLQWNRNLDFIHVHCFNIQYLHVWQWFGKWVNLITIGGPQGF